MQSIGWEEVGVSELVDSVALGVGDGDGVKVDVLSFDEALLAREFFFGRREDVPLMELPGEVALDADNNGIPGDLTKVTIRIYKQLIPIICTTPLK